MKPILCANGELWMPDPHACRPAPRSPARRGDHTKDIDFSRKAIRSWWTAGYGDARRVLADAPWEAEVDPIEGLYLHECRPAQSNGQSKLLVFL